MKLFTRFDIGDLVAGDGVSGYVTKIEVKVVQNPDTEVIGDHDYYEIDHDGELHYGGNLYAAVQTDEGIFPDLSKMPF